MSFFGVVAGLGAAYLGAKSAKDSAGRISDASDRATGLSQAQYDQARQDQAPYREIGYGALNAQARLLGLDPVDTRGLASANQTNYGSRFDPDNLSDEQQIALQGFNEVYGFNPIHNPEQALGVDRSSLASDRLYERLAGFEAAFGYDPTTKNNNPLFNTPPEQGQEFIGGSATNPADRYGGFEASPGYQFRLDEGNKAIERAASAGGYLPGGPGGESGAFTKGLMRYGQGLASQEFGEHFNRLGVLAGTGQTATNNTQIAGQNFVNSAGSNLLRAGDAEAAGLIGSSNAWQSGLESAGTSIGDWWESRT